MRLTGQTVLITGGTSGIGFEFAKQLLKRQNTVLITGRDAGRLEQAKANLPGVETIVSDAGDPRATAALYETVVQKFPAMNVLINNAGIMRTLNLHDETIKMEDVTREIETNLNGPIRMVKQFLPHLKSKPAAAIMNVSSGLAFVPFPISPVYSATKAGLHSFTQSLRVQMKNTAVKIFELAPPATGTELLKAFDAEDMKKTPVMDVVKMVSVAIQGLEHDTFEIRPGASNLLKLMSRFAPGFILGQMSKPVDRMLAAAGKR